VKLVTSEEMKALEDKAAAHGRPPEVLMEDAGLGVAQEVWINLGAAPERNVVVLVGSGNNGGDGLVAARHLHEWGAHVTVVLLFDRGQDDTNLKQLVERGVPIVQADGLGVALDGAEAVIDAVLGTGRARPIEGALADALDIVARRRSGRLAPPVFAVDLPTGVDADSGAVDPHALRADVTIVLGCSKVGLHTLPGAQYAGRVEVIDLGLPKEDIESLPVELLNARWVRDRLPQRPAGANKGTFGKVLVVAGSRQYVGAAQMAALGAMRSGAGLVTVACPQTVQPPIASGLNEATYLPLPDAGGVVAPEAAAMVARALASYGVLLLGPGLGQGASQTAFVRQLVPILEQGPAAVIDADGLNALAALPCWHERLAGRCVLTPHPGEFARLSRATIDAVQGYRLATARDAAKEWGQVVVLKGAHTVVASPGGPAAVSPYANPGLASAGTGDVLAGAVAGLLAQGASPFEAACCGVYLHAAAAEGLRPEMGDAGLIAGDLLVELPRTQRELRAI
jgi:NAD(P)H-hydrate epimerase